jgi:hypothetical protein
MSRARRNRRRHRDGGDEVTGGDLGGPFIAREQNWCHRDGFGNRSGHAPAPQSFTRHHQINRVGSEAVEVLRHGQCGHSQFGQSLPDFASGCGVARCPGPNRTGHIRRGHRRVDTGSEVVLLRIECEPHRFTPALSLGNPSRRSAMILR